MDNLNKVFWTKYYDNDKSNNINDNSSFATFVYDKCIREFNKNQVYLKIADLGCGNCRDSNFLQQHGNLCHSVDINGVNKYPASKVKLILSDVEDVLKNSRMQALFDIVSIFQTLSEYAQGWKGE